MIDFTLYIDPNYQLVTMQHYEGGDSLQKTTFLGVAQMIAKDPNPPLPDHGAKGVDNCEIVPATYVRNPDPTKWYSNPNITSRDQIASMIVWAGFMKQPKRILKQLWENIKRGGFYQNELVYHSETNSFSKKPWYKRDIMGPSDFMEYMRALYMCGGWWKLVGLVMYIPAIVTDLQMLIGSVVTCVKGYINPDFADDDNKIMSQMQEKHSFRTPISVLASYIYFNFRPVAGYIDDTKQVKLRDTQLYKDVPGHVSALLWKHRGPSAPPLGDYWAEKVFGY